MNRPAPATARLALPLPDVVTPRLRLRSLTEADIPALARHAGDRRVAEGTRSIPHPLPEGAAAAFVAAALDPARDEDVWAIDSAGAPAHGLVGVISLKHLGGGQSQIGYWIAPEAWGAGLASEAVRALVAANPHAARTLFAEAFQDNPASARVLDHAGFDYIGDAEARCLARGDIAVPTWTYLRRMT